MNGVTPVMILLIAAACAGGGARPSATADEQVAAMELGFASGSMLAQVALPVPLRRQSYAGFARTDADLRRFMATLAIPDEAAAALAIVFRDGFAQADPIAGASAILNGMNVVKDRLSAGMHPELMSVFRIGMVVAHTLETSVVVTRGDPKPEHLQVFAALTGRYRTALPDDLAQAGLPPDLTDAVRRTNIDLQTTEDLAAMVGACLTVQELVGKMKTR
jgi:hypothetical protein